MLNEHTLINEMEHLRRFALRLCKNTSEADDLLQSTLLRAIEKKDLFENGSDVFKWTSKIMFNTFVTAYRRKAKFETLYDPETFIEHASSEANNETKIELAEVGEAMRLMSDEHRDVLIMICVEGMRYQDVAELLSLPIGTVRSRLSRARGQLQLMLHKPRVQTMMPPAPAARTESWV